MDVSTFTSQRRSLATAAGEIAYTEFGAGPAAVFVHGIFFPEERPEDLVVHLRRWWGR